MSVHHIHGLLTGAKAHADRSRPADQHEPCGAPRGTQEERSVAAE